MSRGSASGEMMSGGNWRDGGIMTRLGCDWRWGWAHSGNAQRASKKTQSSMPRKGLVAGWDGKLEAVRRLERRRRAGLPAPQRGESPESEVLIRRTSLYTIHLRLRDGT